MKASALWLGVSLAAMTWAAPAMAQDAPQAAAPQTDTADATATGDDDIIVTATRRSENLMTSPIAASVLTGNQLENKGVVNVDALQFATPSIVVNNFGQGNDFNVRGIGKAEHNSQTTTGVITYRDGVPSFPGYVQGEPYYDIANIQVLRGPQGTIVGQNATGGAVFVNTNDPVIGGGFNGYVQAQYGNYNDLQGQAAINLPVGDTFAMRISAYGERRDSYYNITGPAGAAYPYNKGDVRIAAGRISLLWKPTDGLSISSKTDLGWLDFGAYPAGPFNKPGDLFDQSFNAPQGARDKFIRTIFKIDYQTASGIKLRSVSSYAWANTLYKADLDGTSTGISYFFDNVEERQYTQEFNIISPDNQRFTWLVGAFGVANKYYFLSPYQFIIDLAYPYNLPAYQYKLQGSNPTRSLAAFGQVGFNITPSLKIEAGGRYTASRSTNHGQIIQYSATATPFDNEQTTKSDNFSYKVSLGWKADENNYLYGFVATGFRPGGLNVPVGFGPPAAFKPEEVRSIELGWKANFAGGHIRTTVNGFYNDYKNFQVTIGYPTLPTFGIELNVPGNTKIYGFEAEAEFRFGGFSLDTGINVLHSELGTFFASDPRASTTVPCDPNTGPVSATCLNLAGRRQTYAPNFTFNVGAQYEFSFGADTKVTPRVNYGHIGNQWATLFENPARGDLLPERNILNAQLAVQYKTFTLTAYANNLTNQHYPAALNSGLYFAGPPRTYGVKLLKVF